MNSRCFYTILFLGLVSTGFSQTKTLTLEDIWQKNLFKEKNIEALRFMKNSDFYTAIEENKEGKSEIVKYSIHDTALRNVLLSAKTMLSSGIETIDDYQFSEDEQKIIILNESEKIYRHSTKENIYVFDFKNNTFKKISAQEKVRLATLSPNGNAVAYVRDNDLLYYDIDQAKEIRITSDGQKNIIINGATDWVYEEEFAFDRGYEWSPDGKKIAFYRFDESRVKQFSMDVFGGNLYPSQNTFKYPKAGEYNAIVSLMIYNTETKELKDIPMADAYEYIPRIKWTQNSNLLCIQTLNRHQNQWNLYLYDAQLHQTQLIREEKSETYIDITDNLFFLKNSTDFLLTSDQDGYNHIYRYDLTGNLKNQVTKGNWDVQDILAIDEAQGVIYFSSKEDGPEQLQLYACNYDGTTKKRISNKAGWHEVIFSPDQKIYIDYYSNTTSPTQMGLYQGNGKLIKLLETNEELANRLKEYKLARVDFFKVKTRLGHDLNAWMIKPADFVEGKKYPVLMYVYGGPGSQTVENQWGGNNYLWYQYLAQQGYIVVSVDNRGTGGRGRDFKKQTYKQLGKLETADQIEAAHYLSSFSYVDTSRIGIWGWSYGGYMSSLCLLHGAEYFKMGIAVAPVTHWKFYDSIYTERYLQTPAENPTGYEEFAPLNWVDKLKGQYLLIHGNADDNVHFQNSAEMVNALISANKQYDFYMYPDRAHGISGANARYHLYQKMTNFILENL